MVSPLLLRSDCLCAQITCKSSILKRRFLSRIFITSRLLFSFGMSNSDKDGHEYIVNKEKKEFSATVLRFFLSKKSQRD
jgi:hypothetical protein